MLCVLDVVVRVRVVCCVVVGTLVHTGIRVASDTRYEYTGVLFLTCCTRFFWSPDDWTAASSAVMLVGALHPHGIPCHVVKLPVTLQDETQRIGGVHECPIHTLNLFVEHVDNVAHAKTCPPKFQPNKKFMWTRQKEERPQRLRNVVFFSRGCRHATRRPSVARADLRPRTAFGTVFASAPTLNPLAHRFALVGLPRIPKVWFIFFVCRHGMLV